jgi:hypothetical protein
LLDWKSRTLNPAEPQMATSLTSLTGVISSPSIWGTDTVGSAVPIVKQATAGIPIVFAVAIDPVDSGLVVSLAHPGCNVTGLTIQATDLAGNRRQCDGLYAIRI